MSRLRKSRSLKRVTGGVKTGSKERTKLENKQRKAKQKAANPVKSNRQRSVYQRFVDENEQAQKEPNKPQPVKQVMADSSMAKPQINTQPELDDRTDEQAHTEDKTSLWDQLETPTRNDTF